MKRNHKQNDHIFSILGSWIKGIWSSFKRFLGRLFRPNQGRRPRISTPSVTATERASSPLVGIKQFMNAESLTVGELMGKVQWRTSKQVGNTVSSPNVKSIRNQINWD